MSVEDEWNAIVESWQMDTGKAQQKFLERNLYHSNFFRPTLQMISLDIEASS